MTKKTTYLTTIISVLALAGIPQLLFFWLAPPVSARLTIYCFGTLITLISPLIACLCIQKGGRGAFAGTAVMAMLLELVALAICTVLLAFDCTVRSSIFALTTFVLLYTLLMTPLLSFAFRQPSVTDKLPPPRQDNPALHPVSPVHAAVHATSIAPCPPPLPNQPHHSVPPLPNRH